MKGPILRFKSQKQLDSCLKWWQEKLGLQNWLIKASVVGKDKFYLKNCDGENSFIYENRESAIHILKESDFPKDSMVIYCAEVILVHELLHCIYNYMKYSVNTKKSKSFEFSYLDVNEHQKLETMSKTLIMVKYDLPLTFFLK